MNKIFLVLIVFFLLAFLSPPKKIQAPPGTIWIKDNLYMDETETTNLHWHEFLWYIKHDSSYEYYRFMLPDTKVWKSLWREADSTKTFEFGEKYFSHPSFNDYPVVGITYEQASAYCKWRTEKVKEVNLERKKEHSNLNVADNFEYRLPTKSEWEYAAAGGLDTSQFPYGFEKLEYKKHYSNFITNDRYFHYLTDTAGIYDTGLLTSDTKFGHPNKLGFYCMIGNVAEMISEKGIAKGGSFFHSLEESKISKEIKYDGAKCWLGFRCICEVK